MPEDRPSTVRRRPACVADEAFRARLFAETHGWAFAGLDAALADLLLPQQRAAQEAGYRARFPGARLEIVEAKERPVGRLVSACGP